jgi:hypothetical protein
MGRCARRFSSRLPWGRGSSKCGGGKLTLASAEPSVSAMYLDATSVFSVRSGGDIRHIAKP